MQQPFFQTSKNLIVGLSLIGILCSCTGTPSSSYEPSSEAEPEASSYIEEEIAIEEYEPVAVPYEEEELALTQEELEVLEASQRSQEQNYQSEQPSTYTIDQMNQDLHEEQIKFEREQLDSERFGIAQESIINNYSTFCPSTGPCD